MRAFALFAVLALALPVPPAEAATQITVETLGSILNESLALPAQDTPGSGIGFQEFFSFTLPVKETVTLSVSDSAIGAQRIVSGELALNDWTSTSPVSPFQPLGAFIEGSAIVNVIGGQEATVSPDALNAGAYFAEVSGISGSAPIHIAIDGTVTAVSTPEASTWAMLGLGFILMGLFGRRASRSAI